MKVDKDRHPFNVFFSRTTWISRQQKGKPIWILMKQETSQSSLTTSLWKVLSNLLTWAVIKDLMVTASQTWWDALDLPPPSWNPCNGSGSGGIEACP